MTRNQEVFSEAVYDKKVCLILSRRSEFFLESIYKVGRIGEKTPQTTRPSLSEYSVPEIDFRYTEPLSLSCPLGNGFPSSYLITFFQSCFIPPQLRKNHSVCRESDLNTEIQNIRKLTKYLKWWRLYHSINVCIRYTCLHFLVIPYLHKQNRRITKKQKRNLF